MYGSRTAIGPADGVGRLVAPKREYGCTVVSVVVAWRHNLYGY